MPGKKKKIRSLLGRRNQILDSIESFQRGKGSGNIPSIKRRKKKK